MGFRANSVEFLTLDYGPVDPVAKLMHRADGILVDLSCQTDPTEQVKLRAHLDGIIDAVHIITFAKVADVKQALRNRWDAKHQPTGGEARV
jgi:hypothetical protein